MKVDACVATAVRAMRPPAACSVRYTCGEYANRAAGHESLLLKHSATSNARVILYNIAHIRCTQGMKVDVCVATTVREMRHPAGHGVMYIRGDYTHRAAFTRGRVQHNSSYTIRDYQGFSV